MPWRAMVAAISVRPSSASHDAGLGPRSFCRIMGLLLRLRPRVAARQIWSGPDGPAPPSSRSDSVALLAESMSLAGAGVGGVNSGRLRVRLAFTVARSSALTLPSRLKSQGLVIGTEPVVKLRFTAATSVALTRAAVERFP